MEAFEMEFFDRIPKLQHRQNFYINILLRIKATEERKIPSLLPKSYLFSKKVLKND
jgi:hypothetical protein